MASKLSLTVSQLNEYVRRMFQLDPLLRVIELRGEISNIKYHQTGTLFFSMKDEQASISCVMYAQDVESLQAIPFDGMRAVAAGSVGLYPRSGQYQMLVKTLHAQGVGVLYERLLALKQKLEREGLFDSARKHPLPGFVHTVGVVTSPTGAVIHDILNVSLRRDPCARILLCPVRVQGVGAPEEIARALALLDGMDDVNVIIVARGGGSMEDLWTFNEESVVRAVAACKTPIVSAVGHETDVTLCDLAADLRAPTPSAAAECVMPLRSDWFERLALLKEELKAGAYSAIQARRAALGLAQARFQANQPAKRLEAMRERLAKTRAQMQANMCRSLNVQRQRLAQKRRELSLLSPDRVLSRGYAVVLRGGKAVTSVSALNAGEDVILRLADGSAEARIASVTAGERKGSHGAKEEK